MTFTDENWREWLLLLQNRVVFAASQISLITPLMDTIEMIKGRLDDLEHTGDDVF